MKAMLKKIFQKYEKIKFIKRHNSSSLTLPHLAQISWKDVHIAPKSKFFLGEQAIIKGSLHCLKEGAELKIGKFVFIGGRTTVISTDKVSIGDSTLIAQDCYIIDSDGHSLNPNIRRNDVPNRWKNFKDWSVVDSQEIKIDRDVWIGPHVTILKGVSIGEAAVIAANSVVTKNIPAFSLAAGNPAKVIKKISG